MNQDIFHVKFSSVFEHVCSLNKVFFTCEISHKSVIFTCVECHKTFFYRLVKLDKN
jgi:hypothetical protein